MRPQLAGDTDLAGELAGDGDLLPAGEDPFAENPPAVEQPATADEAPSTTRRRRRT